MKSGEFREIKSRSDNGTILCRNLLSYFFPIDKLAGSNREILEKAESETMSSIYGNFSPLNTKVQGSTKIN